MREKDLKQQKECVIDEIILELAWFYCATVPYKAIESANVVGYLDYSLSYGYNFFAPVFEKVDPTEDLMLSDISLADAGDGASYIQVVTTGGELGAFCVFWINTKDYILCIVI